MSTTGRGFLAFYVVALVVGVLAIELRREPPVVFVASRDLKANEMLKQGDIVARGRNHYARHAISKGAEINADTIASVPEVLPRENEISFAVAVPPSSIGGSGLALGEQARVCKDGKALEPVIVRLIQCAPQAGNCLGLAGIASSRAAELGAFFDQGPLPYLQPLRATPVCQ
jgi:hypothetical protein